MKTEAQSPMVRVEVASLEGAALDWAVAKAEGVPPGVAFSTDSEVGGQICHRERIITSPGAEQWSATIWLEEECSPLTAYGPTPLVAAMRCYVEAKLIGKSIEVPAALVKGADHG